jgi:hypothetical protein
VFADLAIDPPTKIFRRGGRSENGMRAAKMRDNRIFSLTDRTKAAKSLKNPGALPVEPGSLSGER